MLRKHYSLRTLFITMTLLALALLIFQQFQSRTWNSGLRDSEIYSATVEFAMDLDGDDIIKQTLKKSDAIKFIRLAEKCPIGAVNTGMGGCTLPGTPVSIGVEFKIKKNRTLRVVKLGQHLLIDTGTDKVELIYIGSELDEFFRMPG